MDSSFRRCKTPKGSSFDFTFRSLRRCKTSKLRLVKKLSKKKDRLSGLPDDILVCILSFLTMNEAVRTSLLSKRWRHVWAYNPLLIFDGPEILNDDAAVLDPVLLGVLEKKYICWVDQVVSSHKAPTVDEFKVQFILGEDRQDKIDKWVRFAVGKRVMRLQLDLGSFHGGCHFRYNFPSLSLCNSLTSLQLTCVNVTGEVLESLIDNCKALEVLSVTKSPILVDLKVVGPSLNLKSLRIYQCFKFVNLEISAPNLVSMDYFGLHELCMPFKSTPKLAKLSIGGIDRPDLMMSFITHQIEVLNLYIRHIEPFCKAFPKCPRVRTLDVSYDPKCEKDLFRVTSLIEACPFLHKIVIQLGLSEVSKYKKKWKIHGKEPWCHYQLKIVEIVGFEVSALGFVRYLVKNVVSLEKLIIDPQPQFELRTPGKPEVNKKITKAQKQAEKLRADLKPETELEIR